MSKRQYSVLVADDEPEDVESITRLLKLTARKFKDNITVFQATSGTEVLSILKLK